MKKVFALLLTLGLIAGSAPVASAFSLVGDYTGPLEIKFSDWSKSTIYLTDSGGYGKADGTEDAFGIFKISTIKDLIGTTLWYDGKDGEELTGMYYGIDDDFWALTDGPDPDLLPDALNVQSLTADIDVYLDSSPDFTPVGGPLARIGSTYPGATDGSLFLKLKVGPGIKFGNGIIADDHIGYDDNIDFSTSPFTGDGAFYADVTGGSHAGLFDSNVHCLTDDSGATVCRDFFGQFDTTYKTAFGWPLVSEDPLSGHAVPEPASMLLLGSGFIGMVGARLRKKNA